MIAHTTEQETRSDRLGSSTRRSEGERIVGQCRETFIDGSSGLRRFEVGQSRDREGGGGGIGRIGESESTDRGGRSNQRDGTIERAIGMRNDYMLLTVECSRCSIIL